MGEWVGVPGKGERGYQLDKENEKVIVFPCF